MLKDYFLTLVAKSKGNIIIKVINTDGLNSQYNSPIEKINNAFRMHIIIKNDKKDWLKLYEFIIKKIGVNQFEQSNKKYKTTIDIDPISFL